MARLEELVEILPFEEPEGFMDTPGSEKEFYDTLVNQIVDNTHQVELYYAVLLHIIEWAIQKPDTTLISSPETVVFFDPGYQGNLRLDIGTRKKPDRVQFKHAIIFNQNKAHTEAFELKRLQRAWIKMQSFILNNSISDNDTTLIDLGYSSAKSRYQTDYGAARNIIEKALEIDFSKQANDFTIREMVNYVVFGNPLVEHDSSGLSDDEKNRMLELRSSARLVLLNYWFVNAQFLNNNGLNDELEINGNGTGIEALTFTEEERILIESSMKITAGPYRYKIVSFFLENFSNIIDQQEEYQSILSTVLLHPSFSFDPTTANADSYIEPNTILSQAYKAFIEHLKSRSSLIPVERFDLKTEELNDAYNNLIKNVENVLQSIRVQPINHEITYLFATLDIFKLAKIRLADNLAKAPTKFKALDPNIANLRQSKINNKFHLLVLDECSEFYLSETKFDYFVYSPDRKFKFDFLTRRVYITTSDPYELLFDYFAQGGKNGLIFRKKLFDGFEKSLSPKKLKRFLGLTRRGSIQFHPPESSLFTFSSTNWRGIYHLYKKKNTVYVFPNIINFRSGIGWGTGRADPIKNDELYCWSIPPDPGNGMNDSQYKSKLAKLLGLNNNRFVPFNNLTITETNIEDGFFYEYIEYEGSNFVRVNLPELRVNPSDDELDPDQIIRTPIVDDDSVFMLNRLNIYYFRKLNNEKQRVLKDDRRNNPKPVPGETYVELNLPVSFADVLGANYRKLHRFQYIPNVDPNETIKRKWLNFKKWKDDKILGLSTKSKTNLGVLMGQSATEYAKQILNLPNAKRIWKKITNNSPEVRTDQEWCHMQGRGDGGPDDSKNLVAGSFHCNTEQLAIEMAQRLTTQTTEAEYELRATAYMVEPTHEPITIPLRRVAIKRKLSDIGDTEDNKRPLKKRRVENTQYDMDVDLDNEVAMDSSEDIQLNIRTRGTRIRQSSNNNTDLAAFLRYKIYKKDGRDEEGNIKYIKLVDYTFEAQSEFFDKNQFAIVNRLVEFSLKGQAAFQNRIDRDT